MQVCEYVIEGNHEGPTLVFIHGWPDNASLWRHQVAALASDFRCVLITLPNFGAQSIRAGGFRFPELVELIHATIDEVQPNGKVTLITHDWGAYIGYLVEQSCPERVERMVAMDVGGMADRPSLRAALMILGYQWALVFCWFAGGLIPPLGNLLSKGVGKIIRVPDRQRKSIRSRYNYPYFYFWQGLLLPWKRDGILQRYRPRCPVVYLYGTRKPLQFHSERWLDIVAASGGFAQGIEAGHWFQEQRPEAVNALLMDWLGVGLSDP